MVASNAGKDRQPSWYLNLRAIPEAQVQVGREIRKARAREATPEERERLWPRLARQFGGYEVYQERTSRPIPVLILELFSGGNHFRGLRPGRPACPDPLLESDR